MVWLVTGAYFIAQAFRDTNLGRRIAYLLIRAFGRTSLGLGYAAAFSDFIIAPVTPSNAARTGGIIWPIFRSIAEALDSYPEKIREASELTLHSFFTLSACARGLRS